MRRTHEQRAIGCKHNSRCVATGKIRPWLRDKNLLHIEEGLAVKTSARQRGGVYRAGSPVLSLALSLLVIGKLDETVGRKLRMKRDIEQAAGAASLHLRYSGNGLRIEDSIADDPQSSLAF